MTQHLSIESIMIKHELDRAIEWTAMLNSLDSQRMPEWLEPEPYVIVTIDEDTLPTARQKVWKPNQYPDSHRQLIASLFHIDDLITVVLEPGFAWLLNVKEK